MQTIAGTMSFNPYQSKSDEVSESESEVGNNDT